MNSYKQKLRDDYNKLMKNNKDTVDDSLIEAIEANEVAIKIVDTTTQSEAIDAGEAAISNNEIVITDVPVASPTIKLKAGSPFDSEIVAQSKRMTNRFTGPHKEYWLQFYGYHQWTGLEAIPSEM